MIGTQSGRFGVSFCTTSAAGQLRITWQPTQSSEKGRAFPAADSVGFPEFVPWEPRDESAGLRSAPNPLYRSASSCSRRWAISWRAAMKWLRSSVSYITRVDLHRKTEVVTWISHLTRTTLHFLGTDWSAEWPVDESLDFRVARSRCDPVRRGGCPIEKARVSRDRDGSLRPPSAKNGPEHQRGLRYGRSLCALQLPESVKRDERSLNCWRVVGK
jgi:hypothetical protein